MEVRQKVAGESLQRGEERLQHEAMTVKSGLCWRSQDIGYSKAPRHSERPMPSPSTPPTLRSLAAMTGSRKDSASHRSVTQQEVLSPQPCLTLP